MLLVVQGETVCQIIRKIFIQFKEALNETTTFGKEDYEAFSLAFILQFTFRWPELSFANFEIRDYSKLRN